MQPTRSLLDALFREEVEAARRMSPEEKFLAGPRLFEYASQITLAGIRSQHPEATEEEIRKFFSDRLNLRERLDEQERQRYVKRLGRGDSPVSCRRFGS